MLSEATNTTLHRIRKDQEVLYFSANANGEAEVVNVLLKPSARIRKNKLDIDFSELAIKGRDSKGNLVTKYPIKKIEMKEEGVSTLAPRKIWFDEAVRRLNADARGTFLGTFKGEDKILLVTPKGEARLVSFDLSNRFDDEYIILEKWKPEQSIGCIYYDGEKERYFVKRFLLESTNNPQLFFPSEHPKSFIEWVSTGKNASAELIFSKEKGKDKDPETILIDEFITVKGIKALGNQLSKDKIRTINITIPEPEEEEVIEEIPDTSEDFDDDGTIGNLFEEGDDN